MSLEGRLVTVPTQFDIEPWSPTLNRQRQKTDGKEPGMNTPFDPTNPIQRCGAKTRSGEPCQAKPMPNGRCRMHGGSTPRGPAAGSWKHGRYSKAMPTGLLTRYQEGLGDKRFLELRDEIALLDARINDVLSGLRGGDEDWDRDTEKWREVRKLIMERKRLVKSAREHIRERQMTLTVEEALVMVEALSLAVKRNVPDPYRRRVIASEFMKLLKPTDPM